MASWVLRVSLLGSSAMVLLAGGHSGRIEVDNQVVKSCIPRVATKPVGLPWSGGRAGTTFAAVRGNGGTDMPKVCVLVALALAVAGCGWLQPGFDSGRSAANGAEHTITPANVAQLEQRTIPVGTSDPDGRSGAIVIGDRLITSYRLTAMQAFDRRTCPSPASAACTPVWTAPDTPSFYAASDGTTIFTAQKTATANVLYATGLDGRLEWTASFPDPQSIEIPVVDGIVVSGGRVLLGLNVVRHGSMRLERVVEVLAAAGCGQPTCSADRQIETLGTANFVASGTTLIGLIEGNGADRPARVRAVNIDSGEQRWRSQWFDDGPDPVDNPAHGRFVARNGVVSFHQYETDRTDLYDIDGSPCSNPAPCARIRNLVGTGDPGAFSDRTIVTEGSRLAWYHASGAGCAGTPRRCSDFAVTRTGPAHSIRVLGIAGGVVYAVRANTIEAYDEAATSGCTGVPGLCSPLWSAALDPGGTVRAFSVWDGHVYVTTQRRRGRQRHGARVLAAERLRTRPAGSPSARSWTRPLWNGGPAVRLST